MRVFGLFKACEKWRGHGGSARATKARNVRRGETKSKQSLCLDGLGGPFHY